MVPRGYCLLHTADGHCEWIFLRAGGHLFSLVRFFSFSWPSLRLPFLSFSSFSFFSFSFFSFSVFASCVCGEAYVWVV